MIPALRRHKQEDHKFKVPSQPELHELSKKEYKRENVGNENKWVRKGGGHTERYKKIAEPKSKI